MLPLRNLAADAVDILIAAMGGTTGAAVRGLVGIETGPGAIVVASAGGCHRSRDLPHGCVAQVSSRDPVDGVTPLNWWLDP